MACAATHIAQQCSADILEAVKSREVAERYRGFDYEIFDASPDAYADVIRRETLEYLHR
jgi:hypothetical protein